MCAKTKNKRNENENVKSFKHNKSKRGTCSKQNNKQTNKQQKGGTRVIRMCVCVNKIYIVFYLIN